MQPFFSVIIPALNEENFIPNLLGDLKNQTEKDFAVIVVEGHSTDNTVAVCEPFAKWYPLEIYTVAKRNVAYQRNVGAQKATGQYLVFIDADNTIPTDFLAQLKLVIHKEHYRLIAPWICPDENTLVNRLNFAGMHIFHAIIKELGKPFSSGGSMVVEKTLFQEVGGFNEKAFAAEDHQFAQDAYRRGVKIAFVKQARVIINLRRGKKEGLALTWKYIWATLYFLAKGKVEKPLYKYEFGGDYYTKT